jgi:hypothetical protein
MTAHIDLRASEFTTLDGVDVAEDAAVDLQYVFEGDEAIPVNKRD